MYHLFLSSSPHGIFFLVSIMHFPSVILQLWFFVLPTMDMRNSFFPALYSRLLHLYVICKVFQFHSLQAMACPPLMLWKMLRTTVPF